MIIDNIYKKILVYLSICLTLILTITNIYIYSSQKAHNLSQRDKIQSYEAVKKVNSPNNLNNLTQSVMDNNVSHDEGFIIKSTKYLICGHTTEEILNKEKNVEYKDIVAAYPDYNIDKFTDSEIVLSKQLNEKCPNHYIISNLDGKVVVLYQEPQDGVLLKEITNISTYELSQENQKKIKLGIVIDSNEKLAEILEDIGS